MGKILDYPCDYTNIDYDNNDENFIVQYRVKKNSNLEYIYSFVCSINDKKKQLKEFKRRLVEIDKVLKPLGFKAEMEINYRIGASLDFYKTEIYKVE
jgi:transposase